MMRTNIFKNIKIILLSSVVILIAVFFMSSKANLDIDEAYTYGLANNSYQMQIENFKEYTGEELLIDYAAVKDGEQFNVKNVFFNQKMDTHPPLYFLLVNIICSINKMKFSMWYGLIINILFLVVLFWNMSYLLNKIIKDETFSIILSYLALLLYGFINFYTFTRMYVMLSAISMSLVSLVINSVDSKSNNDNSVNFKFTILFYITCVIGILTQYHFMIIAGFFSIFLLSHYYKYKLYKQFIATFLAGVLSIFTSVIIFPAMINHIFNTSTSMHAINTLSKTETLIDTFRELILGLNKSFFGIGIIIFIILILIGIVVLIIKKKLDFKNFLLFVKEHYLYFVFLLCAVFYFIVICFTVKFSFQRYIYNIYPLIYIIIISPIYIIYKTLNKYLAFVAIVFAFILSLTTNYKNSPTSLNVEDGLFSQYLYNNRDTKMILLYRTVDKELNRNSGNTSLWKMPSSIYIFKDMKNMTFVDISNDAALTSISNDTIEGHNDIFLVIYTFENDDYLISNVMAKNNVSRCEKVYFTTYYHMYHLH